MCMLIWWLWYECTIAWRVFTPHSNIQVIRIYTQVIIQRKDKTEIAILKKRKHGQSKHNTSETTAISTVPTRHVASA
jgi:hypothetical protein